MTGVAMILAAANDETNKSSDEDARLAALVRKYEESEDMTRTAREKSERDRDYYDNKQLTQDEYDALVARGQPPVAMNLIRSVVEFYQGLEKKQRRDPKAYPRNNPEDLQAAGAFTDGMRYVIDQSDYPTHRSAAWRNITVEGFGGVELWVKPGRDGNHDICMDHIPWDRLVIDPHSSKPDFSDANYKGQVLWLDFEEAVARYVKTYNLSEEEVRPKLESTFTRNTLAETYDDKPRWQVWSDYKRRRVRIIALWCKYPDGWWLHEFTLGGILVEMPSPYVDPTSGENFCPVMLDSAYVDRENARYGAIRHFIDAQDEFNKRRSKALHQINTKTVIATAGVVTDRAQAKRELAKPDGWIELDPEMMADNGRFEVEHNTDLSQGQVALAEQAMRYIERTGQNDALRGVGVQDQSGRAIEAQQQGGMIEHGDLMDTLRRFDRHIFRAVAMMMQQFWRAPKWIRVSDNELAPQWVGLNMPVPVTIADPATGQQRPVINPMTGQPIVREVQNQVAELDLDIIISDAPDTITLDSENYASLADMIKTVDPKDPRGRMLIELHPGLTVKQKSQLIDMLETMAKPAEKSPEQAEAEEMAKDFQHAKTGELRSRAFKNAAQAEVAMERGRQSPFLRPQAHVGAN